MVSKGFPDVMTSGRQLEGIVTGCYTVPGIVQLRIMLLEDMLYTVLVLIVNTRHLTLRQQQRAAYLKKTKHSIYRAILCILCILVILVLLYCIARPSKSSVGSQQRYEINALKPWEETCLPQPCADSGNMVCMYGHHI